MAKKKLKLGKINGALVIAIDPGISGAIIVTDGSQYFKHYAMPILNDGKNKTIHFDGVHELLHDLLELNGPIPIFLERAVPMAMGSKHAFNYGRGFEAIVIAIELLQFPVIHVEPLKWAKEMHEGISSDLKPKAKSLIAVKRLFPQLVKSLPKKPKGGLHDGPIDALLIAGYGLRRHKNGFNRAEVSQSEDFF